MTPSVQLSNINYPSGYLETQISEENSRLADTVESQKKEYTGGKKLPSVLKKLQAKIKHSRYIKRLFGYEYHQEAPGFEVKAF